MKCKSNCLPDQHPYTWIKNGKEILPETSSSISFTFFDTDHISCAAPGYEKFPSPSVYMPKLPSVSLGSSGEILEGSSITLICTSDANPAANYTWYKRNVPDPLGKDSQLVFKSVQSSDTGKYFCKADNVLKMIKSEDISVDVEYAPRLPLVSLTPSGEIVEGSSVTLTCSSDANPAANYSWFKENDQSLQHSRQNFTITNIGRQHSGIYYCDVQNKRGSHKSAIHLTVVAWRSFKIRNITKLAVTILLLLILLIFLSVWMRKKKTIGLETERKEHEENLELGTDPNYENISSLRAFAALQKEEEEKQNNPM
ncbi:hypothetical protein ATANTOWER_000279 [Ataeniobius toweri]|uniref:Ig-like domain-containing protein n=1 Tax=Ataeniobius toweri TaxID=208326 RepID=A0ABU7B6E2_9TELE|nr:hypothetical protein [Ataeniobius toweri]